MSVDGVSSSKTANKKSNVADAFNGATKSAATAPAQPVTSDNASQVIKLYNDLNAILAKNGSNCDGNKELTAECQKVIDDFVAFAFSGGKTELTQQDYTALINSRQTMSFGNMDYIVSNVGDFWMASRAGGSSGPLTPKKLKAHLEELAGRRSETKPEKVTIDEDPFGGRKTPMPPLPPPGWGGGRLQPAPIEGDDSIPEKEPVTDEQRKKDKQESMKRMEKENPELYQQIQKAKNKDTALEMNETVTNPAPPRP